MATRVGAARGSGDGSSVGPLSTSTSIAVTAGDAIFVICKWEGADTTVTVADNASGGTNTYTSRADVIDGTLDGTIHTAIAKASETLTFSMTLGAARAWRHIAVIVGRPAASTTFSYDNAASAYTDTTAATTGSMTTAGTGGFAVYGTAENGVTTHAAGSGWTEEDSANDGTYTVYSSYRALTNETSITGNVTLTDALGAISLMAAMKETASGASIAKLASYYRMLRDA